MGKIHLGIFARVERYSKDQRASPTDEECWFTKNSPRIDFLEKQKKTRLISQTVYRSVPGFKLKETDYLRPMTGKESIKRQHFKKLLPKKIVFQKLPLSLLKTAQGHPMLVELKNGETYNGHLVNCDTWMNIHLREVICTSKDGDRFWRMPECYIRGNTIKYLRVPDEVIDKVQEETIRRIDRKPVIANRGRGRGRNEEGGGRGPTKTGGRGAPEEGGGRGGRARGGGRGGTGRGGARGRT
ncbi:sm-like protein LSM4 isoform X1 [Cryptomeria japonica]|uniref:sm-like protein LSM4 isoform X1 n=1 Tax=Cryptomeria japonica TaxID=3369 RepID=UPI0027D9F3E3|nr:sm-like protein LSM4 isoform X1 [Cryptomeria japonica]